MKACINNCRFLDRASYEHEGNPNAAKVAAVVQAGSNRRRTESVHSVEVDAADNCRRFICRGCMYVCIEVALRGDAHGERAFQLGQGEGPIGIVGPISQPRSTIGTASLTLIRTNARGVFWINFTLGS